VDETNIMIDAASDADVNLMVAENYRFLPTVDKCKEIIDEGNIGELRLIQVQAESYGEPTAWRTSAENNGGGVFIDGGIHFVDLILNIGGYPERVYAATPRQVFTQSEGEDGMVMNAVLPGGAVGLINMSRATPIGKQTQWVQVTGTKGQISFEPYGDSVTVETRAVRRNVHLPPARRGVRPMAKEFHQSILEKRPPVMSGEEALKDLRIVLAAYESASEMREVRLSGN
jgi:predicted dehydrogenase